MFQFKAQIIDNGGKQRFFTLDMMNNSITRAAFNIMRNANVQEGGHVRFARLSFDCPSERFTVIEYEFDVIGGKVENLKPVE